MRTIEVDENTAVKYRGTHRDIHFEVCAHRFKEDVSFHDFHEMAATYIFLTEEMHEKHKSRINDLPWNGGQTYYRKCTEELVDAPTDLKERFGKPYYKIGDDFSHLWDQEMGFRFSRESLTRHIKRVIDAMLDGYSDDASE